MVFLLMEQDFPTILYQLSKGVLSILFGEKYNNFQEKGINNTSPIALFKEVLDYLDLNDEIINVTNLYESVLDIFMTNSPKINTKLKIVIDNSLAIAIDVVFP